MGRILLLWLKIAYTSQNKSADLAILKFFKDFQKLMREDNQKVNILLHGPKAMKLYESGTGTNTFIAIGFSRS